MTSSTNGFKIDGRGGFSRAVWCASALCVAMATTSSAQLTRLNSFTGGQYATSGLTQITGGDYVAGLGNPASIGRFNPQGGLNTLYTFASDGSQGTSPNALVQASDGNLYGTCLYGGANSDGTIYELSLRGQFTLLYTFQGSDGRNPLGKLIEGEDGALYGVTEYGGAADAGTVFRITRTGQFTSLFAFDGNAQGYNVNGGLILARDGNFYGTTFAGGSNPDGIGTVFKISPQGQFTSFYSFDGIDGYLPNGPVIQRSDGNFYGTATFGGRFDFGVVYRLTPAGVYSVLASPNDNDNGADPFGSLLEASDGNLYGITDLEYYYLGGTAFHLNPAGQLSTLASFQGDQVNDGLIQAEDGGLRGVSRSTLFALLSGLPKPKPAIAQFQPAAGAPGARVTIRGAHFIYANQVMFNGVPAAFQVSSTNFIQAVVPSGAATGPISVSNMGGTTTSKASFTVTP